jgi:hypothetical protein
MENHTQLFDTAAPINGHHIGSDDAQPVQFTEAQARADLAEATTENNGKRPSIRALADRWNWSKGRAERFLSKIDEFPSTGSGSSLVPHVPQDSGTEDEVAGTDDEPTSWGIERQLEIIVRSCTDGSINIEQEGDHGSAHEDGGIVMVAQSNAVALARRILWAAGFKGILISKTTGGGYEDLNDGDTP